MTKILRKISAFLIIVIMAVVLVGHTSSNSIVAEEVPTIEEGPYDEVAIDDEYDPTDDSMEKIGKSEFYYPVSKKDTVVTQIGNTGSHAGRHAIDIASYGAAKIPIYASAAGIIESVGNQGNSGYGIYVIIRHNSGFKTLYAHFSSLNVKKGDLVYTGKKIGNMGSTGNSTGVHLHLELIKKGVYQEMSFIRSNAEAKPLVSDVYILSYHANNKKKTVIEYNMGVLKYKRSYNDVGKITKEARYSNGTLENIKNYSDGKMTKEVNYHSNGTSIEWIINYRTSGGRFDVEYYDRTGKMTKEIRYHANGTAIDWTINYRLSGGRFDVKYYDTSGLMTKEIRYRGNGTVFDWIIEYKNNKRYHLTYYNTAGKFINETRYNPSGTTFDYSITYQEYADKSTKPYKIELYDAKGVYVETEYYAVDFVQVVKFRHANGNDYYVGYIAGEATDANSQGVMKMKLRRDRPFFYKYDIYTKRFKLPSGTLKKDTVQTFTNWMGDTTKPTPIYSAKEYDYVNKFSPPNGYQYYIGYVAGEATDALKMKLSQDRAFFYQYDSQTKKFAQPSGSYKKGDILEFNQWFDNPKN